MSARFFYLHGFNSGFDRKNPKIESLSTVAPIRGFNCNYLDPDSVANLAVEIITELQSPDKSELILVGTSLGGYFARYFSELYGVRCIMINPATHPHETLLKHVGQLKHYKSGVEYTVTADQVKALQAYDAFNSRVPSLAILAEDDDVIDHSVAHDLLKDRSEVIITKGGHQFTNINSDLLDRITKFVNQVPVDPIDHEDQRDSN